jgi:ACS family D-galactonate transporter-like MFS transporter
MTKSAEYRYWPLAITGMVFFVGYLDRINLAVVAPVMSRELGIKPGKMGILFSIFLIGYAIMPLPAGLMADKVGSHKVLTLTTLWFSVFCALTALGTGFLSLSLIRLLFGFGEGASQPAMFKANQTWSGNRERGLGTAILLTGVNMGGIVAPLMSIVILRNFGWRPVFYLMAVPGLVVALLVWLYVKDRPQELLSGLEFERAGIVLSGEKPVNRALLYRSRSLWAMFFAWFGFNLTFWGLISWVPSYFFDVRHVNLRSLGIWSSLPWVGGLLGAYVGGWIGDRVLHRKYVQMVAWLLAGACTGLTYYVERPFLAVMALMLAYFAIQCGAAVHYSLMMVLVGVEAQGTAIGSMQFVGVWAGFIAPPIIGFILQATNSYAIPFMILGGGISIAGLLVSIVQERRIDLGISAVAATVRAGATANSEATL